MSTSSSAPAREREPDNSARTSPFPYENAGGGGAASDPKETNETKRALQIAELLEQGRAQGRQLASAEMAAALLNEREQIAQALHAFKIERTNYYRRVESEVVQLAMAIARKILHREAQLDSHALAGIVRVTIEGMDAGTKVILRVAPRDVTEWRHYFAREIDGPLGLEIHEESAMGAGECRIETTLGATDIGFESQLKEIETGLLDLLADRPGGS
jgi:flagellar assembly protein FliH